MATAARMLLARCLLMGALVGLGALSLGAMAQVRGAQVPGALVAPPSAGDSMEQRMQACTTCHGKQGRATRAGYFPRLAGKPAGYLFNQMQNFREGRRQHRTMNHLMQHMSDEYLRDIAAYFANLDLPYPPPRHAELSPEQARAAERLVLHGAPDRKLPACVACHGADMAGRLPAMPGLLDLPTDYLIGQLGAWRSGLRHAMAPDCMADVARALTAEEIGIVARWLSARARPAGAKIEPAGSAPLPLRCGSGLP